MEKDSKDEDASNIPHHQAIEEDSINFRSCNITDGYATAIAESLKKNYKNTTQLDLSDNQITDVGALAIREALKNNISLILIDLRGNKISPEILGDINESLKRNMTKKMTKVTLADLREPLPPELENYEKDKKDQTDIASDEVLAQQDKDPVNIVMDFDEASMARLDDLREPLPEGYAEEESKREVVLHMSSSHFISEAEKETKEKQRRQGEQFVTETTSLENDVPLNSLAELPTSSPRTSISNPIAAVFKIEETKGNTLG